MKRLHLFLLCLLGFIEISYSQVVGTSCVNVNPSAPSVILYGTGSVNLIANSAPSGFGYRWFDSNGTTQLSTNQTLVTPTLSGSKTYYLAYVHTATSCLSVKVPVRVIWNSENRNLTRTYSSKTPLTTETAVKSGTPVQVSKTSAYYDSLGRPSQTVAIQATVNGLDLVTVNSYDNFGRASRAYLPFANNTSNPGLYRTNAGTLHSAYYTTLYSDSRGFSEKTYEASPLNRVSKEGGPGTPWIGKEVQFNRNTNLAGDSVRVWTLDSNGMPVTTASYPNGALSKEEVIDENGQKVIEYKDLLGRVILKKVQVGLSPTSGYTGWLSTFYVYDSYGRLRVVIPPKAVDAIRAASWQSSTSTNTSLGNELYFRYSYDQRGRMIEKRVPGKGVESMVYDNQDRLVGYQDGNMAAGTPKKWQYTKYDALGRVVMTGLVNSDLGRAAIQTTLNGSASNNASILSLTSPVSSGGWPTDEGEILTINYYDSYQFLTGFSYVVPTSPYSGFTATASTRVHGLQTGKRVRNLETGVYYTTAMYYDDKGRVIQTLSQQQLGGTVRTSTAYNFEDQPTQTLSANSSSPNQAVLRTYTYNVAGMLDSLSHKIGSQSAKTIAKNTYNDLGQLTTKAFRQLPSGTQTYSYNIRGWLKTLGSGLTEGYKQTNYYETGGTENHWNGNISRIDWSGKSVTTEPPKVRTYNYLYDKANRITAANYSATGETNWYTVSGMTYDANGNITAMTRRNERTPGTYDVVDQLTYTYQTNSNKLSQVADANLTQTYTSKGFIERSTAAYAYDSNGNLRTNLDKQINNITYNHLNLPVEVTFNTGASIRFTYNAEGAKLTQKVYNTSGVLTTIQDYIGEFVYQNGALDYLIHEEEDRALKNSPVDCFSGGPGCRVGKSEPNGLFYEYYLKDHLGNVRQVLRNSSANFRIATMEQANAAEEESTFTQIKPTRKREPRHNVTQGGQEVAWLNASMGEMVGPGTTQEIFEGDSVTLSVHGKFLDKKKARVNEASFLTAGGKTALLDQLNELALNSQMAGGPNPIAVLNLVDIVAKDLQKKETPEAYLIYALYDEDSNRYEVGKKVLTRNAANQHEELEEKLAIKKNGYIETFVVNETSQDVWFDNFKILSQGSILVQETHYDPWGLELTGIGYEYAGVKKNKYLYNGIEYMDDSNLNIYSAEFRNYDPAIGRWLQIDPYDKEDMSPYSWVTNNPIIYADPLGLDSVRYNNLNKVVNPNRDIVLPEVTISASYTGPKASDSPNVKFALSYYFNSERPLATGAVEPIFLTPNPIEALVGVTDNLSRGEIIMAGIAGFALLPGGKTARGVVKAIGLPVSGKIRFIPRIGWTPTQPLTKGPKGGYLDRFGNEWIKKKVSGKGPGEIHWDVQLSPTGKFQLGHLSNSGNHLNVTVTGQIAH